MCKAHFISCFANSCNLIKILKQYLNIFVRNFVLCIQIRSVSTEKKLRASPRVHLVCSIMAALYTIVQRPIGRLLYSPIIHDIVAIIPVIATSDNSFRTSVTFKDVEEIKKLYIVVINYCIVFNYLLSNSKSIYEQYTIILKIRNNQLNITYYVCFCY